MWVIPDEAGIDPSYQQHEIDDTALGGLVTIASGIRGHDAAIGLHNRNAALHGARLPAAAAVNLPAAPYLHRFPRPGPGRCRGCRELHPGDAVRFTDTDGRRVTGLEPSELLIWEMHARLGG